jgi:flagellar hook-length control protein FliK
LAESTEAAQASRAVATEEVAQSETLAAAVRVETARVQLGVAGGSALVGSAAPALTGAAGAGVAPGLGDPLALASFGAVADGSVLMGLNGDAAASVDAENGAASAAAGAARPGVERGLGGVGALGNEASAVQSSVATGAKAAVRGNAAGFASAVAEAARETPAAAAQSAGASDGGLSETSGLPNSSVAGSVTVSALGGANRISSAAVTELPQPVTPDQLPASLDRAAIELAKLRGGTLVLQMAPADLGRLSFEMRIDDSGMAIVAIRLADDSVRGLVENAAGALRDVLSQEGFKLDSFTVSSGFGSPERRENSQNPGSTGFSGRQEQSGESVVSTTVTSQPRNPSSQSRPGAGSLSLFA